MKIKKLTATFGALDGAVPEPGTGLTVITAPNEGGKSSWAGFWKAMLYGIDTRERDKSGFLADKTRYLPWSGAPMAGEAQVEWGGREVTLRRFPTRTNPFGGFEAVYTATGDPVPGLAAANAGEQLTGVGREVYLRSAFVGQGGAAIGASRELEARIAALATSGEEDVAYSAVERTLKDWRNRRRANRANGLIPELEEERARLDGALREMDDARRRKSEGARELERLEERQKELQGDLETWARIEKHQLNRRYGEAYLEWERAKAAVPGGKPHPVFKTMSGEEAWAFAQGRQREREAAIEESRRREQRRAEAEKQRQRGQLETLMGGFLGAGMLLMLAASLLNGSWLIAPFCALAVLAWVICLFHGRKLARRARETLSIPTIPIPEDENWLAQAAEYREELAKAQQARAAEAAARRRMDDLAAQGGQLFDTLELLHEPSQPKAATAAQLAAVERELAWVQKELARVEGELSHMGAPEDVEARRGELDGQLARRLEEYDALTAALEALGAANDQLRQRFSPALNEKAGGLFAALTGGRWDRLTLARDFSAQAAGEGTVRPHSALALSTGTAEQLYLAVRLAVCQLTAPDAPILLDDALATFDDGRMALALALLKGLAEERQILLFSCHRREAEWAKAHDVPVIEKQYAAETAGTASGI